MRIIWIKKLVKLVWNPDSGPVNPGTEAQGGQARPAYQVKV